MSGFRSVILCGAAVFALSVGSAVAQNYGSYSDVAYQSPSETIEVTAPRFHSEVTAPRFHSDTQKLNGPLEKVSLSSSVRYDDLNLRSRSGARELRARIRDAAGQTCAQLADAYPVREAIGTSCYKTALENGLVRANEVIADARLDARYGYER